MPTAIICIVLIVICVIAVRSYCKKLKNGCCGAGGDVVKRIRPADKEAEHYPYSCRIGIDGMTCKNCALRVENAFHEREGFYAQVHLKEHCAVVYMKAPGTGSRSSGRSFNEPVTRLRGYRNWLYSKARIGG